MQTETIRNIHARDRKKIFLDIGMFGLVMFLFPMSIPLGLLIIESSGYNPLVIFIVGVIIPTSFLFWVIYIIVRRIIYGIIEQKNSKSSLPPEFRADTYHRVVGANHTSPESVSIDTMNSIPGSVYSQGIIYRTEKEKLLKRSAELKSTLITDIRTTGTSYASISEAIDGVGGFSKQLLHSTDELLALLPETTTIMSDFGSKEVFYEFVSYLQDEMDGLKKISRESQNLIQGWMLYHSMEVSDEKKKLEKTIQKSSDNFNHSIGILMNTINTLKQNPDTREVEEAPIRQRV